MGPVPGNQSGPPASPDVLKQQMPPMQAFSAQGQQMLNGQIANNATSADPKALVSDLLGDIKSNLLQVLKVISQTNPELVPLIQKMAEAGQTLEVELTSNNADQATPDTPPQAETPGDMALGQ